MRIKVEYAAASILILLTACGEKDQQTSGPSAQPRAHVAPVPQANELTTAPQPYQRMRFVSSIEQSKMTAEPRKVAAHRHEIPHLAASSNDPMAVLSSHTPAMMVTTAQVSAEQPTAIVAVSAGTEPARITTSFANEGAVIEQTNSGRSNGPMIGSVVIRGGSVGTGKCDPRTDTHTTPQEIGRPDFAMPQPIGRVFGGARRR